GPAGAVDTCGADCSSGACGAGAVAGRTRGRLAPTGRVRRTQWTPPSATVLLAPSAQAQELVRHAAGWRGGADPAGAKDAACGGDRSSGRLRRGRGTGSWCGWLAPAGVVRWVRSEQQLPRADCGRAHELEGRRPRRARNDLPAVTAMPGAGATSGRARTRPGR